MTSTEFDQAKSNMLLLDSNVQDVSLRPGAGGYVQFNEREGGIGMATTTDSLSISATDGVATQNSPIFTNLVTLVYSGGTSASAAVDSTTGFTPLRGEQVAAANMTQNLGFLRLEQNNGAKIKLDYDRVRVVSTGLIDSHTNLVQVTFIHLKQGEIGTATGTVNVMVQNIKTTTTTWTFNSPSISITVQHTTNPAQPAQVWHSPAVVGATATVVMFSEIQVGVSIK